jgi:predicted metal-dependent hydrolase
MREEIIDIQIGQKSHRVFISFQDRIRFSIYVHPDKRITAKAPENISLPEVKKHLQKRSPWIIKQLAHFEKFQPLPAKRYYISGETHLFLGRQYRLSIRQGTVESVKLIGPFFQIITMDKDNNQQIKKLLEQWYIKHANEYFLRRVRYCISIVKSDNIGNPRVVIKKMKKRWGSCSSRGRILLNAELIKTPLDCIDYVIIHEICHLKHRKHDSSFFRQLERWLPHWRVRKERLEKFVI